MNNKIDEHDTQNHFENVEMTTGIQFKISCGIRMESIWPIYPKPGEEERIVGVITSNFRQQDELVVHWTLSTQTLTCIQKLKMASFVPPIPIQHE